MPSPPFLCPLPRLVVRLAAGLTGLSLLCQCGKPPPPAPEDFLPSAKIKVVTTTTHLAELAREIGGDAVVVECLVTPVNPPATVKSDAVSGEDNVSSKAVAKPAPKPPWNPNPFQWSMRANDLFAMQTAHVVVLNGLGLEKIPESQLDVLRSEKNLVVVMAGAAVPPEKLLYADTAKTIPDPCIWNSPQLWKHAASALQEALKRCVPVEAGPYFDNRAHAAQVSLDKLSLWTEDRLAATHEKGSRFLLSSHDTLRYFAQEFGIETRALLTSDGIPLEKSDSVLKEWLAQRKVTDFFPDAALSEVEAQQAVIKYSLTRQKPTHTLYLARPGTSQLGLLEAYDVGTHKGAFSHMIRAMERRMGDAKSKSQPAAPAPASSNP